MEKTKLFGVLKSFTTSELRAFEDFVQSPFFNKNQDLVTFYKTLKENLTARISNPIFSRKQVFNSAFPKQLYDEKYFNHLCSWLLKLAERFLAIQTFENQGIYSKILLLNTYVDRQLEKQYQHIYRKAGQKINDTSLRNEFYYQQMYQLAEIAEKNFVNKDIRESDPHLQKASDYFDIYLLAKKLRYLCAMIARQKIIAEPYKKTMVFEVQKLVKRPEFLQIDLLHIYHELFQILTSENPEPHFRIYKEKLKTVNTLFTSEEIRDFYYYGINFCISMLKRGEKRYAEDLMQLYQDGIDGNYLLDNGQLSPWAFKNMVRLGLNLKKFIWVENFVKDYSTKLNKKVRDDAYFFNMADIFYNKKDYDQALIHLNKVEFTDIHYNLDAKQMLLKIYYETSESEAFLSLIFSFRIFLKRNKVIAKDVKEFYKNFVDIIYQIHKYGKTRKGKIENKIKETPVLNGRTWLLQKLGEL